jgi:hypothetical protein
MLLIFDSAFVIAFSASLILFFASFMSDFLSVWLSLFLDLNAGRFERSQLKFLETKEWVRASDGFFNEFSSEALLKNGAFFLEKVDDNKLLKEYALVYKGKIVVEGNKFDKVYQETLLSLKRVSYDADKVKSILEIKLLTKNKGELNLFHGTTPSAVASIHKEGVLLSANKVYQIL